MIELFDNPEGFNGYISDLDMDGLIHAICRGGWPTTLSISDKENTLLVAKDLFQQICEIDMSNVDDIKRNPELVRLIIHSYSQNLCQPVNNKKIIADVRANSNISDSTFYDYIQALEKLYIVSNVDAWCPSIRSKTVIRSSKKKNLIDPLQWQRWVSGQSFSIQISRRWNSYSNHSASEISELIHLAMVEQYRTTVIGMDLKPTSSFILKMGDMHFVK